MPPNRQIGQLMDSAVNCGYVLQTDNDGLTLLIRARCRADKLPRAVFRVVRDICDPVVLKMARLLAMTATFGRSLKFLIAPFTC
jgi:hypothetical protein